MIIQSQNILKSSQILASKICKKGHFRQISALKRLGKKGGSYHDMSDLFAFKNEQKS